MSNKNRFTAAAKKMDANFDSSIENEDQDQEVELQPKRESENIRSASKIKEEGPKSKTEIEPVPTAEIRMTRKTTAMPLVLALAVKELKDRRNLAVQKGKGRTTDDDIMVEALKLFFSQSGEFSDSLEVAENRLRNYS